MEQFEKVEKLRQRANVSYEEAKEALEASDWDLLDAMVYLEKLGKVQGPEKSSYSTDYEEQPQYLSVQETVNNNSQYSSGESFGKKMGRLFKKLWRIGKENYFRISRRGEEVIKVPVWLFVVALLFAWHVIVPVMLIVLFFECHYSFCGKANLDSMNSAMEKASDLADKVKDEYNRL